MRPRLGHVTRGAFCRRGVDNCCVVLCSEVLSCTVDVLIFTVGHVCSNEPPRKACGDRHALAVGRSREHDLSGTDSPSGNNDGFPHDHARGTVRHSTCILQESAPWSALLLFLFFFHCILSAVMSKGQVNDVVRATHRAPALMVLYATLHQQAGSTQK